MERWTRVGLRWGCLAACSSAALGCLTAAAPLGGSGTEATTTQPAAIEPPPCPTPAEVAATPAPREPPVAVALARLVVPHAGLTTPARRLDVGDVEHPGWIIVARHGPPRIKPQISHRGVADDVVSLRGAHGEAWQAWRAATRARWDVERGLAAARAAVAAATAGGPALSACDRTAIAELEDRLPALEVSAERARERLVDALEAVADADRDAGVRVALAAALEAGIPAERVAAQVVPVMRLFSQVADDAEASPRLRATALTQMARVLDGLEEHGAAASALERLFALSDEPSLRAEAAYRLGALSLDPARARAWYTRAVELGGPLSDPIVAALAAHELAYVDAEAARASESLSAAATSATLAATSAPFGDDPDPMSLTDFIARALVSQRPTDLSPAIPKPLAVLVAAELAKDAERRRDWDGATRALEALVDLASPEEKSVAEAKASLERVARSREAAAKDPRAELRLRLAAVLDGCRETGPLTRPLGLQIDTRTAKVEATPDPKRVDAQASERLLACVRDLGAEHLRSLPPLLVSARVVDPRR